MLAKRLIYGLLLGVTAGPPLTPPVGGGLSRLAPPVGGDDDCHAQDSLLLRDYQFVKQYDGWLTSSNAAGLNRYNRANIGEAKLSLSHEEGGLTDYFESPSATQLSAATESFYRISERAVVFGRIAYDNFSGKEMAGSAFIDPTRRPFDIVEDSQEYGNGLMVIGYSSLKAKQGEEDGEVGHYCIDLDDPESWK